VNDELKLARTVDALFGEGVSACIPQDVRFTHSRTGRIRSAFCGDDLLCTLRIDGGLALAPRFAQMLLAHHKFRESCVEVSGEAAPFVREGRSVFARHVVRCGGRVAVSAETPVTHEGTVIAVGRAVLSAGMMAGCDRGVAVRIRNGLKNSAPRT
jgi:uncharacterized protein with predicted RNA binding PUA domain